MRRATVLLAAMVLAAAAAPALGHVPEVGGDDETAVDDPSVSRVFYRAVDAGDHHVYRLRFASKGELVVGLQSPRPSEAPPSATVTGPGVDAAIDGPTGQASYEPFAPDVLYPVDRLRRGVDAGTYTVTVSGEGPYALVVGEAERFTAVEWVLTGVAVPRTRLWSGRWWLLAPGALVAAGAIVWLRRRGAISASTAAAPRALAGAGGALCCGSGAATATALVWAGTVTGPSAAALVAVVLAALQAGVGALLLRTATAERLTVRWGLATAGLGVAAATVWAGAVLGPALALSGAATAALQPSEDPRA